MAREWTPSPIGFAERCSSNPERVGRDGFLGLRFERRLGCTVLAQCRFRLPLQALTPIELADGTASLLLLNPTGGLVGGDFSAHANHPGGRHAGVFDDSFGNARLPHAS